MVKVYVENIVKKFGEVVALNHITQEFADKALSSMVGPSGCGKTTLLRVISGLYDPDEGDVYFDNEKVTNKPPFKRQIGLVFQDYALFPHMTVYENIAYGLKIRKLPKKEIDKKVKEVLEFVKLPGIEKRYPHQLSGGQQQRVALARTLVTEPKVLLLDEPLSNLDAQIRIIVRGELKQIQKQLGITAIYVTHDQVEAMSISDYIAIMKDGQIVQVGTPIEIYRRPKNEFVASFIGQCNFLDGKVTSIEGLKATIETPEGEIKALIPDETFKEGDSVLVVLRPEYIEMQPIKESSKSFIKGKVRVALYQGGTTRFTIDLPTGKSIIVDSSDPLILEKIKEGDYVSLTFKEELIHLIKK
ncbi:MAG: ABC transporter ATP-binding protein [Candidatus Bathyarchaeia archaeon]|nr:ABC transporter ATP-binding protein [Candidatus Bathyarchaeota archaeon]